MRLRRSRAGQLQLLRAAEIAADGVDDGVAEAAGLFVVTVAGRSGRGPDEGLAAGELADHHSVGGQVAQALLIARGEEAEPADEAHRGKVDDAQQVADEDVAESRRPPPRRTTRMPAVRLPGVWPCQRLSKMAK